MSTWLTFVETLNPLQTYSFLVREFLLINVGHILFLVRYKVLFETHTNNVIIIAFLLSRSSEYKSVSAVLFAIEPSFGYTNGLLYEVLQRKILFSRASCCTGLLTLQIYHMCIIVVTD